MDVQSLFDKEFLDDVGKDIAYEFKMVVKTFGEQVASNQTSNAHSYQERNHFFTTQFYNQAAELNLAEEDAIDVYESGQEVKEGIIQKSFTTYELGVEYVREQFSGKPVITSIWKQSTLTT